MADVARKGAVLLLFVLCANIRHAVGFKISNEWKAPPTPITPDFRPPSVPLVVVNPYFSVWSNADHLYDDVTRHWTGSPVNISGMIRIDGKPYRFMSADIELAPNVMEQVKLTVYPLRTVYTFEEAGIQLNLTFLTPSFGAFDERDYLVPMLPYTYLHYEVSAVDGKSHSVQLYYDNSGDGTVNDVNESITWSRESIKGNITMKFGSEAQNFLGSDSDQINWGYWYVVVPMDSDVSTSMADSNTTRNSFMSGVPLPPDDTDKPRPCNKKSPVLAVSWDLGIVKPGSAVAKYLMVLYDQVYSIRYFGTAMMPAWRKKYGGSVSNLLQDSSNSFDIIEYICEVIDGTVIGNSYLAGGSNYSAINALVWRQAVGGVETVWNNITNDLWVFMKEISSDGDISTVDVLYPASPLFLWSDPNVLKLMLLPILDYANNQTGKYGLDIPYNLSWAPHHLGHWPICDIQPTHQEQMPLEESGNMLTMIAVIVSRTGNDTRFLTPYWPLLSTWANYSVASLPNPEDQLCTDDFEGPSPQNVNLAAKGVVGLAAYSFLLEVAGQEAAAEYYQKLNKGFVEYWIKNSLVSQNGSIHYKRQFNLTNSWSLKYNLLFQRILNKDTFPGSVFDNIENFYQTKMNTYGIPLDDRHAYAKADWEMWTAAMGSQQQFEAITNVVFKFANETSTRVPFTDWYDTVSGRQVGFRARPVMGGTYARLLLYAKSEETPGKVMKKVLFSLLN